MAEDKAKKLKAQLSNPDAPARKFGKGEGKTEATDMPVDGSSEEEGEKADQSKQVVPADVSQAGLAAMLSTIMQDIKEVKSNQRKEEARAKKDKEEIRADIQEAAAKAEHAAEVASQAKEATCVLKAEIEKLKKGEGLHEALQSAVDTALAGKADTAGSSRAETAWPMLGVKGRGKGKGPEGKGVEAKERQSRTLTFGQFEDGTEAATVKEFMETTLGKDTMKETEEVFAYGKRFATRGGVRFKSSAGMWKYMEEHAGKHQHEHGASKIYVNVHDGARPAGDLDKAKAVRKMTRAIIEVIGGDPIEVKLDMQPNYYGAGPFKYKGKKVAEWRDGEMKTLEDGKPFAARFRTLMGLE